MKTKTETFRFECILKQRLIKISILAFKSNNSNDDQARQNHPFLWQEMARAEELTTDIQLKLTSKKPGKVRT